ncbi:hypothetical protein [Bailinhaonella thermotolerans]|uniref:Uncharacterized protein n=1 Tax=Bailinhaonella thermotolerans TaxID=1070861 RepID=A0A3A4AYD9_9ACTN|nr:hypothetical protein [Bailinhaonella thermotolerans]RJL32516.1 hypothetical protein D5H75_13400 [Bailinhaonella thermotolerans]
MGIRILRGDDARKVAEEAAENLEEPAEAPPEVLALRRERRLSGPYEPGDIAPLDFGGEAPSPGDLHLREPATQIIVPPYGPEWTRGQANHWFTEAGTGRVFIRCVAGHMVGSPGNDQGGANGLSLVMTTDRPAVVEARPLVSYRYLYQIGKLGGIGGGGKAAGGLEIQAYATVSWGGGGIGGGGTHHTGEPYRSTWFDRGHGDSPIQVQDDGQEVGAHVKTRFHVSPGVKYTVKVGPWLAAHAWHSLGGATGVGAAGAWIDLRIRWIVVAH